MIVSGCVADGYLQLNIKIPAPRFKRGDVVCTDKLYGTGAHLVAAVEGVNYHGDWDINDLGSVHVTYDQRQNSYLLACQEGCLTACGSPIRPGTVLQPSVLDLDEIGELVAYTQRRWSADTHENINERIAAWKVLEAELAAAEKERLCGRENYRAIMLD